MDLNIDIDIEALVGDALALAPDKAFSLFLDVAAQHRDAAGERGFSPEAAEHMATALHSGLVALYFTSAQ